MDLASGTFGERARTKQKMLIVFPPRSHQRLSAAISRDAICFRNRLRVRARSSVFI